MVAKQAANNKIAVPAVHLVELASRHDVRFLKIQKTLGANLAQVNFRGSSDSRRKMFHANPAVRLQFRNGRWNRHLRGKIEHRLALRFRVLQTLAVIHGARQRIPPGRDVAQDIAKGIGGACRPGNRSRGLTLGGKNWVVWENQTPLSQQGDENIKTS